jgi:hypothetical protein
VGTGVLSPCIKQPAHETDHSPPSTINIRNSWSYIFTVTYYFGSLWLTRHRGNSTRFRKMSSRIYGAWLIITGFGLVDWIYWSLLYNHSYSQEMTD